MWQHGFADSVDVYSDGGKRCNKGMTSTYIQLFTQSCHQLVLKEANADQMVSL